MTPASGSTIAIIGCGFVADLYMSTLAGATDIRIAGVFDIDRRRLEVFCRHYGLKACSSLDDILTDASVDLIVNLTNPRAHYSVSKASLLAGKHVYSEKPLAMTLDEAQELVTLARSRQRLISSAPCSLLSRAAQTLWKTVASQEVGPVRLVYAELDDGMVHRMAYRKWVSATGAPWPYKDEFEVGCTLEHAGYYLSWLMAIFGPVKSVVATSGCLYPDKVPGETLSPADAPDFSIGLLQFESGTLARLTTSIIAPHDHRIRLYGDRGQIEMDDCWFNGAPVYIRRPLTIRRRTLMSPFRKRVKPAKLATQGSRSFGSASMDFCLGIREMLGAARAGRTPYLSADFSLHVNEVAIALSEAGRHPGEYRTLTRFTPMEPLF